MNIFVGNLSYDTSDQELNKAFSAFGRVDSASVIMDKFSGRSRGFGFVEMPNNEEAQKAIAGMNGKDLNGRPLTVNEARPKAAGGGGGGRDGGGRRDDRGGRGDRGPRW